MLWYLEDQMVGHNLLTHNGWSWTYWTVSWAFKSLKQIWLCLYRQ